MFPYIEFTFIQSLQRQGRQAGSRPDCNFPNAAWPMQIYWLLSETARGGFQKAMFCVV